ncbi:hypothetical protein RclHR1_08680009 [Rhizophagus clarus]|uniref:Uncharacterized protein n=1 Tax=Rhizophagus clarus TaxID=94130 RepID=A0A2Z6SGN1_9GLOM|nr:hypothetical protein RclHR1_08680009 [Rhizophagus clarus]
MIEITIHHKNNKKKACNWNDDAVKLLPSFLIERKEEVNNLSTKRSGGGNMKAKLWQDASAIFLNDDCKYSAKHGNEPIEVRFKEEVEEILDGNRPSITPKVLNSSLNADDLNNDEEKVPFDEITGWNK